MTLIDTVALPGYPALVADSRLSFPLHEVDRPLADLIEAVPLKKYELASLRIYGS
jgi:hypothetical protein